MNYRDDIFLGDTLFINTNNPMGSGWKEGQRVVVVGFTCTDDPYVTDFTGTLDGYITNLYTFSEIDKKLRRIDKKCISLHRYCLSREIVDEDRLLNNKLSRLGI